MIERDLFKEIEPVLHSPEAIVITGMRRVGKTSLLHYIEEKLSSDNTLFLDLENPLNRKYFEEADYDMIVTQLQFLGLDTSRQAYVFLDEVQYLTVLPSVVKYISDHYTIKFFLSGSSSFYLKNHFTESLVGRKYIFELFPLSFSEFVRLKDVALNLSVIQHPVSQSVFTRVNRLFEEYLQYGGFPGVATKKSRTEKERALEDIFSSYFQLEILQLGEFRKPNSVRDLILLLMERVGSKIDIQKLSTELGITRTTTERYLEFLEDTYFISRVSPFSRNRDAEIRAAKKVYLCDTGLLRAFSKGSEGSFFENTVFNILRLKGSVLYYQRKSGVEIDFIYDMKKAYEVKLSGDARDVAKLKMLAEEIKVPNYAVVSRKYSDAENITYAWML
jgi:predicted AAA+ superfamily ATPase